MNKTLIYCRVSTEEQTKGGHHSLSAQQNICRKLAEDLGYKVAKIYEDAGKSATNMNRPALQDMLIRCQEDKAIKAVLVQDTDRMARNTQDHLTIKALLKKADVRLISASQPSIDDTAEGNMIDTIIASVNQFQADLTSRKTIKGLEEKVRNGGWPLGAPTGYKNVTDKKGNKIIVVDPVKAPLVTKAFKMYATGNYSAMKISELLYPKGLTSQSGKKICNSKIIDLLKNRFYLGEVHWRGIDAKGKHKAIIDRATFDTVQHIMADHNHHVSRAYRYVYLLSGYLYCGVCGSRFTGETHAEKGLSYYRCSKKIDHYGVHTQTGEIEKFVLERFKEVQFSPNFIEKVVSKVKKAFYEKRKKIKGQKKVLYAKKKALEHRRDIAEDKLFKGIISDEDFERNKQKFNTEFEGIQEQIDKLERIREMKVDEVQEVLLLTMDAYQAYKKAKDPLKRQYLSLFWEKFVVDEREIVEAVPTRLFKALQDDYKASVKAHRPVLRERAYVQRGDHHPIRQPSVTSEVQTASRWGG